MQPTLNPSSPASSRLAGLYYLILILSGVLALAYIPGQLLLWKNTPETITQIQQNFGLFKTGLVAESICYLAFLILAVQCYRLFSAAHPNAALFLLIFVSVSVAISFQNQGSKLMIVSMIKAIGMSELSEGQISQMLNWNEQFNNGIQWVQIFWGLWLFPLGYLTIVTRIAPKIIGIALILGCFGYLSDAIGPLFISGYGKTLFAEIIGIPSVIGEFGFCLWVLVFGSKFRKPILENPSNP